MSTDNTSLPSTARRIPLWLKVFYSAFVAVLVPDYLSAYGPTNFLYFCDVALLMTLVAIWLESPLLVSMPAVGILVVQTLWIVDFLSSIMGKPVLGWTEYMFNEEKSRFTRGLSFFHFWLPLLLVWLVWRLGYDRRAFLGWTLLAWVLLLICYFLMPAPPPPKNNPDLPVNINYVYGMKDMEPQQWMPGWTYFLLEMVLLPVVIFWPAHCLLSWLFRGSQAVNVDKSIRLES